MMMTMMMMMLLCRGQGMNRTAVRDCTMVISDQCFTKVSFFSWYTSLRIRPDTCNWDIPTSSFIRFAGFDAVTLANNHFNDFGAKGANFTVEVLKKTGVKYFGVTYGKYDTSQVSITCSDIQQWFKPDILPIPVLYHFYVLLERAFPFFSKKYLFEVKDTSIRKDSFTSSGFSLRNMWYAHLNLFQFGWASPKV